MLFTLSGCGDGGSAPSSGETSADEGSFDNSYGIDENGFWEGVNALDYVEMFEYKGMTLSDISDEDVQNEIDYMLEAFPAEKRITDRAVEDGDTVSIDYVGSVDGIEFEGGSSKGAYVTAGSAEFIDDFLTQIIGRMPGETVNVEVTFPDDYHKADLRGKDAVFVVIINYISENGKAQWNDEFVATNLYEYYGCTTAAEMEETIRSNLRRISFSDYIEQYFMNEVPVSSIPEMLIEYQKNSMIDYYQYEAEYNYNMGFDEYLTFNGFSDVGELIKEHQNAIDKNATFYLVAQAIAEDAGLSVGDEDLADFTESDFELYGLPFLKQHVLINKVLDCIIENAVIE
jgi:trigger factor